MSAELPELERLLATAAERRYGARRRPARWPLMAAAAVVAVAVLALLVARPVSDERPALPPPPADALAAAYPVFAASEDPGGVLAADDFVGGFLDLERPYRRRVLHEADGRGVVAYVGTAARAGEPTVCLLDVTPDAEGGGCQRASGLLARDDPLVGTSGLEPGMYVAHALVREDVTAVSVRFADGAVRPVPIVRNLAYLASSRPLCALTWRNRDGTTGTEPLVDPFASGSPCNGVSGAGRAVSP